jgi:Macro domain
MSPPLTLHLRDLSRALVDAWRQEFMGVPGVTLSQGDIFSESDGPVAAEAPIDIRADAVVSPANSFGFMDGGIDAVYTYQLGSQVQERLRALLAEQYGGELPVGQAVLVPTGRPEIPWCISAPTMRVPAWAPPWARCRRRAALGR